jgi:hypothetical protein
VQTLSVSNGIAVLRSDTDPRSVRAALAEHRPRLLQFSESLPDGVLDAAADALRGFPDIEFRVYGRAVDPSLGWLSRFKHHSNITIDLWHATSDRQHARRLGSRLRVRGRSDPTVHREAVEEDDRLECLIARPRQFERRVARAVPDEVGFVHRPLMTDAERQDVRLRERRR